MTAPFASPPPGGLPPQDSLMTGRAVFTEAYAVIPRGVLTDIVASRLPNWRGTRAWILARPLSGFAETFSQMLMEVAAGGGSETPEPTADAEAALFVTDGAAEIVIGGGTHTLTPGGFAFIPAGTLWRVANAGDAPLRFHWVRKRYEPAPGLAPPDPIIAQEQDIAKQPMIGTDSWSTTRFMDPDDLRHDMAMTIVTFAPGGTIPFEETHVMEHGLAILEGKGVYKLNRDWVEGQAGEFLWLRAFCPQACYAAGPGPFRYLLYKDVNRFPVLAPPDRALG
ncbi:MAG: bifunctional allantoicase/(S)-ureidoglycine aminohydrolase [Pseudomonadota bacterium]